VVAVQEDFCGSDRDVFLENVPDPHRENLNLHNGVIGTKRQNAKIKGSIFKFNVIRNLKVVFLEGIVSYGDMQKTLKLLTLHLN
jgi:hypothetical protein